MEFKNLYHKYQNRDRYREILHILGRHGFRFLLQRRGFRSIGYWKQKVLPHYPKPAVLSEYEGEMTLPRRVRFLFEELGPTFIKLGQILSTRPDLVPKEYAQELGVLQDGVMQESAKKIRQQFINSWGRPPEELFREFDYQPAAAASIAQVHRAVLPDGREVAVKVQRSDVKKVMEKDLTILQDLEKLLQRSLVGKVCDVAEINQILFRQIKRELDFTVEALNMERFEEVLAGSGILVPRVYWNYISQHILTMDWVDGRPAKEALVDCEATEAGEKFAQKVMYTVLLPFFRHGIFHGDPHPGNVFWLDGGDLALVDFGITGRLDQEFRFTIAELMLAINEKDTCSVVTITKKIGKMTQPVNEEHLFQDVSEMLDRAAGLSGSISFSYLINGMIDIAINHGIKMPGSFFLLGKALLTAEGLARRFHPDIDVVDISRPLALAYMKTHFQPVLTQERIYKQGAGLLRGMLSFPRDVAEVISDLAKGELSIVFIHRGLEVLYDKLDAVSTRLAISLIIVAMMVSSALIIHAGSGPVLSMGLPLLGLIGFSVAALLGVWMVIGLLRDGKIR